MGTEISSSPPGHVQNYATERPNDPPGQDVQAEQAQDQAKQAQADQAKEAQKAQAAAEAQKIAQQQLFKVPEKPQSLTMEFMTAFEQIFQEGYEQYKVPQASEGAEVFADTKGKDFQKDLGVIREFIREAKHLIGEQKMDITQMFHWIRSEQGGQFWQRVQQALQRELPGAPRPEAEGTAASGKSSMGGVAHKDGEKDVRDPGTHPGRAMLELLKAEANPRSQFENYAMILQMLRQDGMKESSQRMMQLLKRRYDLSEEDMQRLIAQYGMVYYQGPQQREERMAVNWWYFVGALVAVPTALFLGFDFLWSAGIGVAVAVLTLALLRFSGK